MYEKIRIFKAKFLGPTNTRGARVSISSLDGQLKKTVAYDYSGDMLTQAVNLLKKEGYKVIGVDQDSDYCYIAAEVK